MKCDNISQFQTYSKKMQKVHNMVIRSAKTDATVLLTGERGVGKSYFARMIHDYSLHSHLNFIEVNGSDFRKQFNSAISSDGGTLHIEEVGSLKPDEQQELLKRLSSGLTMRLIVSSTKPLEHLVRSKAFSQELYKYLCIIQIKLPSLRDRKEDIPYIIDNCMQTLSEKYGTLKYLCEETFVKLKSKPWPGNILELENILEHAYKKSLGECIQVADLPAWIESSEMPAGGSLNDELYTIALNLVQSSDQSETLAAFDEYKKLVFPPLLKAALKHSGGNKSRSSELLGINRNTLKKMLKEYEIDD